MDEPLSGASPTSPSAAEPTCTPTRSSRSAAGPARPTSTGRSPTAPRADAKFVDLSCFDPWVKRARIAHARQARSTTRCPVSARERTDDGSDLRMIRAVRRRHRAGTRSVHAGSVCARRWSVVRCGSGGRASTRKSAYSCRSNKSEPGQSGWESIFLRSSAFTGRKRRFGADCASGSGRHEVQKASSATPLTSSRTPTVANTAATSICSRRLAHSLARWIVFRMFSACRSTAVSAAIGRQNQMVL